MAASGATHHIFVVSDATGQTAELVVRAALAQFEASDVQVHVLPEVRTAAQVRQAIAQAKQGGGFVVHTLVSAALREAVHREARLHEVPMVDLLGPILVRLADLLGRRPLAKPGLFHQLGRDYRSRFEIIEYAIKHDDGQNPRGLPEADIVLVGVSRTSKTPTSIYLAGNGWRVANVPVVPGLPLPEVLPRVDPKKIIALTMRPDRLLEIRRARLAQVPGSNRMGYADPKRLRAELEEAEAVYRRSRWPVVDVTDKSIEEIAAETIALIRLQQTGAAGARARRMRRPLPHEGD